MFNNRKRDEKIAKLEQEVENLTAVMKILASGLDKQAESTGELSESVRELVETGHENLDTTQNLVKELRSQSQRLESIEGGIQNILHQLNPSSDDGKKNAK